MKASYIQNRKRQYAIPFSPRLFPVRIAFPEGIIVVYQVSLGLELLVRPRPMRFSVRGSTNGIEAAQVKTRK